jgi:hypothetical protein
MSSPERLTIREALRTYIVQTLTSTPRLVIAFLVVCLAVGYFTPIVSLDKFKEMSSLFQFVFPFWAGAGVAGKWLEGKGRAGVSISRTSEGGATNGGA